MENYIVILLAVLVIRFILYSVFKREEIKKQLLLHYEVINSNKQSLREQLLRFKETDQYVLPEQHNLSVEFDEFEQIIAVTRTT